MKGYNTALKSMETSGIINQDMTTISDSIYNRKKPKDCLNNPLPRRIIWQGGMLSVW